MAVLRKEDVFPPFLSTTLEKKMETLFYSVDSPTYISFYHRSQLHQLIIKILAALCDVCVEQYINVKSGCCRLERKCCL